MKNFSFVLLCLFICIHQLLSQTKIQIQASNDTIYLASDCTFEIRLTLKNVSNDTIVVYNFGKEWNEIVDESTEISTYYPGLWGNWNPGINIAMYKIPDMNGYSMGKRKSVQYSDTAAIDKKLRKGIIELLNSRISIVPNESVVTAISYSFKNAGVEAGKYLIRVFYEMNLQIFKYVPIGKNILLTRTQCNDIVLIVD